MYMKILNFLFTITLGRFYFNWILPTNNSSKNPLFKFILSKLGLANDLYSQGGRLRAKDRIIATYISASIHIILVILYLDTHLVTQMLVNIYPIWVQIYIGIRCWRIIKHKRKLHLNKFGNPLLT